MTDHMQVTPTPVNVTPCERDGHDFVQASNGSLIYCAKCADMREVRAILRHVAVTNTDIRVFDGALNRVLSLDLDK